MTVINTVAVITATPEGADELADMLTELAVTTQAETGCIFYSLQRSLDDPAVFVTVERWASREDLDAHLNSQHVTQAIVDAQHLFGAAPQIIPTASMDAGDPAKNNY